MDSTLKNKNKYLVVKFIGSLDHIKGLKCISSNWLNSTLDRIVFVRYPPPNKRENMLLYLKENFPVYIHWQTYLAIVYYQTDNLRDALLYSAHYTSPNDVKSKLIPKTTTNIKNIVGNKFFDLSAAIKMLTVMEKFMMIRPLIISILQSIDMFCERYRSQSQACHNNPLYTNLRTEIYTYAKFLLDKVTHHTDSDWTDAIDKVDLLSTSTSPKPGVNFASEEISYEIKLAIKQLFIIVDTASSK